MVRMVIVIGLVVCVLVVREGWWWYEIVVVAGVNDRGWLVPMMVGEDWW